MLYVKSFTYAQEVLVEGRSDELDAITQSKFDAWDKIIKYDILNRGTKKEIAQVYQLLYDPTIYAYAWFRDEKKKPYKLYSYQDLVINDPWKRVQFVAANQIGKSVALCIKALTFAITHPGSTTVAISLTLSQSKDLLRRMRQLLDNGVLEYKYDIGDTDTKTELYIRHWEEYWDEEKKEYAQREITASRIICTPKTGATLSYAVDLLLLDEVAFYEDGEYFFKQIAQPRTYFTKGQIIEFSNPNGQQGIYWEHYNSKKWHRYKFTFLDCPNNTKEEFENLCEDLTQQEIDSTLLAEFTSPEGSFMSYAQRKAMQEDRPNEIPLDLKEPLYIFFDFAKTVDRTVRTAGIPILGLDGTPQGVYVYEMKEYTHGTDYTVILEDLDLLIHQRGRKLIAMVGWDNSGVGGGIADFIRKIQLLGIECTSVDFSLQNKSRIYTLFKLLIERNQKTVNGEMRIGIKIPFVRVCDTQLSKLRFTKTQRDYLQVHHENERDRDDYPDSLAGLCSIIIQPEIAPVTATIIGGEDDENEQEKETDEEVEQRFGVPLGII